MDIQKSGRYGLNIFCWLVKGVGLAVLGLLLAIFIGEGPPNPFKLSARELFIMVMLLITLAGLALAVWRQLIGGIVILAGVASYTIFSGIEHNWVFYAFWLIGPLNIICWKLRKLQGEEMGAAEKSRKSIAVAIRLTARIYGSLLAALVLMIAIGEGPPNPFTQPLSVAIELFAMLGMIIGCIVGWKWQWAGALLITGGIMTYHIIEKKLLLFGAFPLFDLAAILYCLSWIITKLDRYYEKHKNS